MVRGGARRLDRRSSDAQSAGYLLVSVFFAYDVVLYLVMTKAFGWWSPADALVHPDVLATYAPWLSAIANSFQAGFWEEALFRAVPARRRGAHRRSHRASPTPASWPASSCRPSSSARGMRRTRTSRRSPGPVELILPSIGFGLLYVYFGLLPGIILHFTFDVVWFALPIFLASAPGIWFDRLMILALTLVPLWIVLYRRVREGGWTELPESDRNAAWIPPAPRAHAAPVATVRRAELSPMVRRAWLGLGAFGLLFCGFAVVRQSSPGPFGTLPLPRAEAASLARRAVDQRSPTFHPRIGVSPHPGWRVLPAPDDGDASGHEFVFETSGENRWRSLLGTYLPKPRWRVRIASFEGDIAERAEEWLVMVTASGEARNVRHTLPEGRAGASLDEAAARRLAISGDSAQVRPRCGAGTGEGDFGYRRRSCRRAPTGRSYSATTPSPRSRAASRASK